MKLNGKVAIVTGASRGIGRAIAVRLAREGCKVVINYNENLKAAQETQDIIGKKNSAIIKADVGKVSECKKLVAGTLKNFGKIDILVNNAGILIPKQFDEFSEEDWDKTMNVNLKGPFFLSQCAANHMRNGSIVNISSIRAFKSIRNRVAYAASKAGIIGMTKSLAIELADNKVRVNAVLPGVVATDITRDFPKKILQKFEEAALLKRLAKPEDIANAVAFLASDDAAFIDGETILVDGGTSWQQT